MISELRLTRELVDQIIFGMENQDREYILDTHTGRVVVADQVDVDAKKGRFVVIPQWRSVDGYNLMERFVAGLRNPLFRERLRQILASGRGVFRQFKDTLHERPEIERLWFSFKEREMRGLVTDWFNDMREREGLERQEMVGVDSETDSLIDSDFVIGPLGEREIAEIEELDREGMIEALEGVSMPLAEVLYRHERESVPAPDDPDVRVLIAETQGGDFAGFVKATVLSHGGMRVDHIAQLYVLPEYRGLGLARRLLFQYFELAHREGAQECLVDLPGKAMDLERKFFEYGMVPYSSRLRLNLDRWYRE
jgi:GNAT superfamily N-acetyltransferase